MQKSAATFWKNALYPDLLKGKSNNRKIAYIALLSALVVVVNIFEFKLADTQFSFTLVASALVGVLIGPIYGFAACFIGDLVGFLQNSGGFMYMPWIGISLGLTSFISGCVYHGIKDNGKKQVEYGKLLLVCLLSFFLCTIAINTTAFWVLYSKVDYFTYLVSRMIIQGQVWNCLVNYALFILITPVLKRLPL